MTEANWTDGVHWTEIEAERQGLPPAILWKKLRVEAGWSQDSIGVAAEMSATSIGKYEKGRMPGSDIDKRRYLNALDRMASARHVDEIEYKHPGRPVGS